MGIMQKKMETTIQGSGLWLKEVYRGYIGVIWG